jgi:hypothetical protein
MLTPYIFLACEKTILGKDDVVSLIALFTKIVINVSGKVEIPENAIAPKEWSIFSMWNLEPGDESRDCMICTEILYPDQSPFSAIPKSKMVLQAGRKAQVGLQVQGFPIGQEGLYTVRTWIEEKQKIIAGPIEFKVEVEIHRQPSEATANEENQESRTKV